MSTVSADPITRRVLLRGCVAAGAVMAATAGCSTVESPEGVPAEGAALSPRPETPEEPTRPGPRSVLLAYFSRPGENYSYGGRVNLDVVEDHAE